MAAIFLVVGWKLELALLHDLTCLLQLSSTGALRFARRKDLPEQIVHLISGPVLCAVLAGLFLHLVVVHEQGLPTAQTLLVHVSDVVALPSRRDRHLGQHLLCVARQLCNDGYRLRDLFYEHIYVRSLRVLLDVSEPELQIDLREARAVRLELICL